MQHNLRCIHTSARAPTSPEWMRTIWLWTRQRRSLAWCAGTLTERWLRQRQKQILKYGMGWSGAHKTWCLTSLLVVFVARTQPHLRKVFRQLECQVRMRMKNAMNESGIEFIFEFDARAACHVKALPPFAPATMGKHSFEAKSIHTINPMAASMRKQHSPKSIFVFN